MGHATQNPSSSTGPKLSGLCRGDGKVWGHRYCFPGPVMVGDTEVLPRSCFCPCHGKGAQQ